MIAIKLKRVQRQRRRMRVRKRVFGTPQRPRVSVFRSLKHIYAQVIDDMAGRTLASASSREKGFSGSGGTKAAAVKVGAALGERLKALGVTSVSLDRNGCRYHGRVRALADALREAGVQV